MDMRIFVESLTLSEMNELSNVIYERKCEFVRANAKPLSKDEMELVDRGQWIQAIKAYRVRNTSSLLEAKVTVDAYRAGA